MVWGDPSLSVVVATRSGAHRLPRLLADLAAQDLEQSWELVVVQDGVTDATPSLLAAWRDRLPMRIVARDRSTGVAAALAAGFDAARAPVLVRCDDDLGLPRDLLRRHHAWHTGGRRLGVVSLTRDVLADSAYARAYGRVANERLRASAVVRPAEDRWMHWAACNSVRRDDYAAVGGFDVTVRYREDADLGWRLAAAGVEIVIDAALTVDHHGPLSTAADRVERAYLSGTSLADFRRRHPSAHPAPAHQPRGLWDRSTAALASAVRSQHAARRLGGAVDRLLPLVPAGAGGRVVAAAVEAAGLAGERRGDGSWSRDRPAS